jgi:tRNA(fMet)-specific endonuclease VapC
VAYLLDTNICIFLMKGMPQVAGRTKDQIRQDLFISEVTVAELKFGVAKSERPLRNHEHLALFLQGIAVIPISEVLDVFSFEKARLFRIGQPLPDFDLLIGATAMTLRSSPTISSTSSGSKASNWRIGRSDQGR